jgi:hypothetical protein
MTNSRTTSPAGDRMVMSMQARPAHVRQSPSQLIGGNFGASAGPLTRAPGEAARPVGSSRPPTDPNPSMLADTRGIATQLAKGRDECHAAGTGNRTRVHEEHLTDSSRNAYFCDAPTRRTDLTFSHSTRLRVGPFLYAAQLARFARARESHRCLCAATDAHRQTSHPVAHGIDGTDQAI